MRLFVFLGISAFLGSSAAADANVHVVEEIIAKVNGDIVTRGEIERTRQALEADARQQGVNGAKLQEGIKDREKDLLRDQIDQLLLVQKGKDLNINVDPEVTKRLAEIQIQSKITDPDKFHDFIREQSGMPFEDFKSQMKNQILTQRVIGQEVGSRMNVKDADKRKYYEEHKQEFVRQEQVFLREILISTEGKNSQQVAAAEKKAKDLIARARKGEKFGELARDNSDALTAKNYGELGAFKRGELNKDIEEIVFKQKKGYVTDIVRVPNGFLILKVEERYEPGLASYEDVENEISERLLMPQMQPKVRDYLTKLRQDAFLEIREGYVDTGAAPGKDTRWKDPLQLKPETTTKEEVAARKKKKLLWIIPRGGEKPASTSAGESGVRKGESVPVPDTRPPLAGAPPR
jgi:peptidyl-prolyl cis-trans isomerase SurA